MPYVLALDQGTTSSRAIVFDRHGAIRGMGQQPIPVAFPADGWVEHDPAAIWGSQLASARMALERAGITAGDLAALGITNQRETTIVWERASGKPIAPAIVWQDRRTADRCATLAPHANLVTQKTGLVLDPYFSATKIAWLLDTVPAARERAERGELAFGTVDTWLIWNLTGGAVHATDHTNASRTLLLNIQTLDWDDELLALFGVPRPLLPELRPSCGDFGATAADVLGRPVRIAGVAGDQQAALFGQAGFRKGLAKNTYGTGSFVVLNTGAGIVRSSNGLLTTVAFTTGTQRAYALEGSIFVTGAAVQWLRDGLRIIASSDEIESLAASVPDNGGVYFVPALTGLGAPYWDPHARGAIYGITRATTRAHLARATLESMAYQTLEVVESMTRDAGFSLRELRVDGGAAVDDLAMQFTADLLQKDVVRPRVTETTALGAAFMAGVQAGFWSGFDTLEDLWREERRFFPSLPASERERLVNGWRAAIRRTRCRE
ncbi:MAG: glycerol kinase GlpK [Candidatus Eremiobacteraeota bacterium]|nr:glycerol kinase GlpK [Candidatus Eremiobacteraeota bacterium]